MSINIAGSMEVEVLELSAESKESQLLHAEKLKKFEAQQRARAIIVPTAIEDVKRKLREIGHPVTLFGENHADRRDRLREVIATFELNEVELAKTQEYLNSTSTNSKTGTLGGLPTTVTHGENIKTTSHSQKEIIYSAASESLIAFRKLICEYSCSKSYERILGTKRIRASEELQAEEDRKAAALYINSKNLILNASQCGDDRPLTCIKYSPNAKFLATSSLNNTVKIWDESSLELFSTLKGHEERVTSLSWHPEAFQCTTSSPMLASTSADGSCILWHFNSNSNNIINDHNNNNSTEMDISSTSINNDVSSPTSVSNSNIIHQLRGHQGPVLDCDFHPSGHLIGTAGQDYSWRLWDIEHGEEILLQDGHIKECSTIVFQKDGALALTGDWAGVALLWDLRSGQAIQSFQGHIKKIVTATFNPNGFQVATAGGDHMVRIWDIRKKKCGYVLPAHSNIISALQYSSSGELLLTSSFDSTIKIWNARDMSLLRTLLGHTGKVMGCDFSPDLSHVVSCGFDRTIKRWSHKDEF